VTSHDHAPGNTWLAERAGVPPEGFAHDPLRPASPLAAATRETVELAADAVSPDPDVRQEASKRAEQFRSRLTTS
jgi:hypothetical protein